MAIFFGSLWYDLLLFAGALLAYLTWYFNSNFSYWKTRNIPYVKPEPFFGNFRHVLTAQKSIAQLMQELYKQLEGHRFGGAFRSRYPILILRDPEFIKNVMVKDFSHFQGRGVRVDPKINPLGQHLVALSGPVWRTLRTKLTPAFTSGKMKMMYQLMEQCAVELNGYLSNHAEKGATMEMKDVLAKFTTDVIGTCAFGLQFNSIADENSEFRRTGRNIFSTSAWSAIKRTIVLLIPEVALRLNIKAFDDEITDFFINLVKETMEYRETNNVKRNDFLQLLIQLKKYGKVDDGDDGKLMHIDNHGRNNSTEEDFELTDTLMAAQLFVFFFAGFETSSTTMSFALYELALNPDIQARLTEEVDATLEECGGKVTYEALLKMDYLDRVIAETLRKYPPIPVLLRECTNEYKIPDSDAILEKGTTTFIPIFAIHHDPKYFPNPEIFNPERFSAENKARRHHFSYLPFGEGPRICIGMRFGLLQSKLGLFSLLSSYQFSVCEDTQIPLKFNPKSAFTSNTTGISLRITKRT